MERSLDYVLLSGALGGRSGLPTPEQLQQLIADVEVQLILRRPNVTQDLFDVAWYLHGVASVAAARERYSLARQRQAFLVSAHIFDLALNQDGWTPAQRLSFGFAAAIGYRRGGRDPNATAIMNRLRSDINIESPVTDHFSTLSIEAGLAFLGFETRTLFTWFGAWRRQLAALAQASELPDLTSTAFGPAHLVVLGADDLLAYFARGNTDRLQRGITRLLAVATGNAGPTDLNARWVAAHLLNLSGEAQLGSLWNPNILPPTIPPVVRQAFTVNSPPVLTLWEPQRELLHHAQSPFDPAVRRMVLAVPTSGGKTLIAQMLSVEFLERVGRGVCYVVPTRSLGREVRRAMSGRVRFLQKETGADQPDFPTIWDLLSASDEAPADVEVMTPERLGHLLRHDVDEVLSRFGMFIFDEAQLIKETGRGFVLESVIALLDYLTRHTDHRIALISAAMGNAGAIAQWISPQGQALRHESEWRGPRRLHAAFTTEALWTETQTEGGAGRTWLYRHTTPLAGVIRLRMANGQTTQLVTQGDTGWRVVRKSRDGNSQQRGLPTDSTRSTKHYVIASEMIAELGHAGSVLVVATTRAQAQQLAQGLAQTCDEQPSLAPLVDFVRQQLGDDHPLVAVLRRGVGFHHAGLPIEVLEALEEAVRGDSLPYLTCTSTLTDGVNLPVRTVVIYDQTYPGQPEDSRLSGARLVNAMGRAGRAGKETEGWIVLVRAAAPTEQDFQDLNPDAEALAVTSSLTNESALASFAELEASLRVNQDSIFTASSEAADFIGFVWLMLAIEEARNVDPNDIDVDDIVTATLAGSQSPAVRARCTVIAETTRQVYVRTDREARLRWPRTGTSIGSARTLDDLARQIAAEVIRLEITGNAPELNSPAIAIPWLSNIFTILLDLTEAPEWRFRTSRQGVDIQVSPAMLLNDWIAGRSLPELAAAYLRSATPAAYRIEQMVGAVTEHFEHYLAWTVGALVELVNARLSTAEAETRLCVELGGYIRYGVNTPHSLVLMTSGVRSRRLAHAIIADLPSELPATREDLRMWLAQTAISQWRTQFTASASEVLDLIDFTRHRNRSLLRTLLEAGTVELTIPTLYYVPTPDQHLTLGPVRGEPEPGPLALYAETTLVGAISPEDHADVRSILETGLDLTLQLDAQAVPPVVRVTITSEGDR